MGGAKLRMLQEADTMTLIGAKSCRSCEYRLVMPGAPKGRVHCRRFPPQNVGGIVPGPNGQPVTAFMSSYPEANPDFPCGEYRRNEMHAAEELTEAARGATQQ